MFRDIFTNRLFTGALAFFVLCVGGILLYMHHEAQKGAEYAAETEDRVRQLNERQKEALPAEAPVGEETQQPQQDGHFQEDGTWREGPQTQEVLPNAQMSKTDDSEIKELYTQLETEGFKPENLSEKQLLHLSRVGLHWDYLSPEQQREARQNHYAQYGLKPPPDGYTYQVHSPGKPVLDEDGNAIISKIGDTSIKKSFGGYLLNVE